MSAPFVIPFNFQPESVSVVTGSYTVPPGKYARVIANVSGSSTFTIGGATALASTSATWSVLASDNLRTVSGGGGSTNALFTNTAETSIQAVGSAFNESTAQMNTALSEVYFLPSGTVINGTGTWRAVVEQYSNIS